jgi:hypothetical protein
LLLLREERRSREVLLLHLGDGLVVIVALEQLLDARPFELSDGFLHRLSVGVLPFGVGVLGVEVVLAFGRDERSWLLLLIEFLPVIVFEPLMVLEVLRSIESQSVRWLALNELVNEVSRLGAPASGDLLPFDLDLLGENVIPDLFAVFPDVRALAEHALVGNNAHCEVVNSDAVVLTAHHLGSHVARSAWRVLRVFRVPDTRNAQVCDPQVAWFVEYKIFRLDVAMQDAVFMKVLKA